MRPRDVFGVVCVFEWSPHPDRRSPWRLTAVGEVSEEGYIGRSRGEDWVGVAAGQRVGDGDDAYYETAPGRLVVQWSWDGVHLLRFRPPTPATGLDAFAPDRIRKHPEWWAIIAGGWDAKEQTVTEARRRIVGDTP